MAEINFKTRTVQREILVEHLKSVKFLNTGLIGMTDFQPPNTLPQKFENETQFKLKQG